MYLLVTTSILPNEPLTVLCDELTLEDAKEKREIIINQNKEFSIKLKEATSAFNEYIRKTYNMSPTELHSQKGVDFIWELKQRFLNFEKPKFHGINDILIIQTF